jgi:hypothetical protein
MRIFAVIMTAMAVSVWWHPMPVAAQFCALLALAVACLAFRSVNKRAEVLRRKLAELREAVGALRDGDGQ